MPIRDGPIERARRRSADNLRRVAVDGRRARLNAGLSQVEVARAIGTSHAKLAIKRRDGEVPHLILVVADTPRNRRAIRAAPVAFADLPLGSRAILAALRRGAKPGGSGIVML